MRQLVIGQFARLRGQLHGPFAVAKIGFGRRGQHPGQIVQNRTIFRLKFEGLLEVGNRLGMFADVQVSIGTAPQGQKVLGIQQQYVVVFGDRLFGLFVDQIIHRELHLQLGLIRHGLGELLHFANGFIETFELGQDFSAQAMSGHNLLLFQDRIDIGQSFFILLVVEIRFRPMHQRQHAAGLQFNHLSEFLDGLVVFMLFAINFSALLIRAWRLRGELRRLVETLKRIVWFIQIAKHFAL